MLMGTSTLRASRQSAERHSCSPGINTYLVVELRGKCGTYNLDGGKISCFIISIKVQRLVDHLNYNGLEEQYQSAYKAKLNTETTT